MEVEHTTKREFSCVEDVHQQIPTKDNLRIINVILGQKEIMCVFCGKCEESLNHCFFTCQMVVEVWKASSNGWGYPWLSQILMKDTLINICILSWKKRKRKSG